MNPSHTKETWAAYMRDYRKKNPSKMKAIDLKKRFGISLEQYNTMLAEQAGVCKICSLPETALDHRTLKPRNMAVDHCHKTNRIRGLLCSDCNMAIGLLKEDLSLFQKASKYLENSLN